MWRDKDRHNHSRTERKSLPGWSSAARTIEIPTAPNAEGSYATRAKLWTGWRKTTYKGH